MNFEGSTVGLAPMNSMCSSSSGAVNEVCIYFSIIEKQSVFICGIMVRNQCDMVKRSVSCICILYFNCFTVILFVIDT